MKPKKRTLKQRWKSFKRGFVAGAIIGTAILGAGKIAEVKLARRAVPPASPPAIKAPAAKPAVQRPAQGQMQTAEKRPAQKQAVQRQRPPVGAEPKRQVTAEKPRIEVKQSFPKPSARMSILLPKNAKCLSPKQIDAELRARGSPAAGLGNAFVKWGRHYGIRPSVALAFFRMESNWGTRGMARETRAIGNIVYTNKSGSGVPYSNYRGFRKYATWEDGIKDLYWLLSSKKYAGGQRKTLGEIIPVYSPAGENNPKRYNEIVVDYLNELFKNSQ